MRMLDVMRDTLDALRRDLLGLTWRALPAQEPAKRVVSVVASVLIAHLLGCDDKWWVAISAFMVMQAGFRDSLQRGGLRVAGTVVGALLALLMSPLAIAFPWSFVPLLALVTWGGLFGALTWSYNYGWILTTITFAMVFFHGAYGAADLHGFAAMRVLDVVVGTVTCVIVAACFDSNARGRLVWWRRAAATHAVTRVATDSAPVAAEPQPAADTRSRNTAAALLACVAAFSVTLLAMLALHFRFGTFPQAVVTVVAVLIVPLQTTRDVIAGAVVTRMLHRFLGCLLAGLVALALLHLVASSPFWSMVALAAGVWFGAHLQSGDPQVRYIGVQFSIAFMMVFVQDHHGPMQIDAAFNRLMGIAMGVAVLAAAMLAVYPLLTRRRRASAAQTTVE